LKKIIIAAVSRNNVIGRDGKIPWHSKEEFKHFKSTTIGFPIIMGRKTFESIGKPLPGRLSIIITRQRDYAAEFQNVLTFHSLPDSIDYCEKKGYEKVFIIGGFQIYQEAVDLADEMIISEMMFEVEGDTYFPEFKTEKWDLFLSSNHEEFEVNYYRRKK
jgi:dihydrofolate reductase